jgi:hypothetical protein
MLAGSPAPASSSSSGSRRAPGRAPLRVAAAGEAAPASAQEALERAADRSEGSFDARAFRRSLNSTGRYTRKPSNDPDSLSLMEEHGVGYSTAGLVAQMRESGCTWRQGDVVVKLAEAYGFCWGVERAVQMAYEARRAYPGQRLHITNEIIHNPGAPRAAAAGIAAPPMGTSRAGPCRRGSGEGASLARPRCVARSCCGPASGMGLRAALLLHPVACHSCPARCCCCCCCLARRAAPLTAPPCPLQALKSL